MVQMTHPALTPFFFSLNEVLAELRLSLVWRENYSSLRNTLWYQSRYLIYTYFQMVVHKTYYYFVQLEYGKKYFSIHFFFAFVYFTTWKFCSLEYFIYRYAIVCFFVLFCFLKTSCTCLLAHLYPQTIVTPLEDNLVGLEKCSSDKQS